MKTSLPSPKIRHQYLTVFFIISIFAKLFIFSTFSQDKIDQIMIYIFFPFFIFGVSFLNAFKTFSIELKKKQPLIFEQNRAAFSMKSYHHISKSSLFYSRVQYLRLMPKELTDLYILTAKSFLFSIGYLFALVVTTIILEQ